MNRESRDAGRARRGRGEDAGGRARGTTRRASAKSPASARRERETRGTMVGERLTMTRESRAM